MNFKTGKLYQIKKFIWLLYPTKDIAAGDAAALAASTAEAAYLSKELNCNISYISENSILCLLEQDGKYLKVISSNGESGWMIYWEDEACTGGVEELKET